MKLALAELRSKEAFNGEVLPLGKRKSHDDRSMLAYHRVLDSGHGLQSKALDAFHTIEKRKADREGYTLVSLSVIRQKIKKSETSPTGLSYGGKPFLSSDSLYEDACNLIAAAPGQELSLHDLEKAMQAKGVHNGSLLQYLVASKALPPAEEDTTMPAPPAVETVDQQEGAPPPRQITDGIPTFSGNQSSTSAGGNGQVALYSLQLQQAEARRAEFEARRAEAEARRAEAESRSSSEQTRHQDSQNMASLLNMYQQQQQQPPPPAAPPAQPPTDPAVLQQLNAIQATIGQMGGDVRQMGGDVRQMGGDVRQMGGTVRSIEASTVKNSHRPADLDPNLNTSDRRNLSFGGDDYRTPLRAGREQNQAEEGDQLFTHNTGGAPGGVDAASNTEGSPAAGANSNAGGPAGGGADLIELSSDDEDPDQQEMDRIYTLAETFLATDGGDTFGVSEAAEDFLNIPGLHQAGRAQATTFLEGLVEHLETLENIKEDKTLTDRDRQRHTAPVLRKTRQKIDKLIGEKARLLKQLAKMKPCVSCRKLVEEGVHQCDKCSGDCCAPGVGSCSFVVGGMEGHGVPVRCENCGVEHGRGAGAKEDSMVDEAPPSETLTETGEAAPADTTNNIEANETGVPAGEAAGETQLDLRRTVSVDDGDGNTSKVGSVGDNPAPAVDLMDEDDNNADAASVGDNAAPVVAPAVAPAAAPAAAANADRWNWGYNVYGDGAECGLCRLRRKLCHNCVKDPNRQTRPNGI